MGVVLGLYSISALRFRSALFRLCADHCRGPPCEAPGARCAGTAAEQATSPFGIYCGALSDATKKRSIAHGSPSEVTGQLHRLRIPQERSGVFTRRQGRSKPE